MKERQYRFSGVGAISLFMIFVILCMVIVSSLSLLNANKAKQLAWKEQKEFTLYYEKEAIAQEIYALVKEQPERTQQELAELLVQTFPEEQLEIVKKDTLMIRIKMKEAIDFVMELDHTKMPMEIITWGRERTDGYEND